MTELTDGPRHSRLRTSCLKSKLRARRAVIGTFVEIPSPAVVELLGLAGLDFVVIDCEHAAIDLKDTEDLIRAGHSTELNVLVRVADRDPTAISHALDMGAAGIHVPQVESAEIARRAVSAGKYHPLGNRGLQPYVRSASYRSYGTTEYLTIANDNTLVVAQIEGQEAIASLESILKVEGLDIAFLGPYDLSQSLGIPGKVNDPRVLEAIEGAIQVAQNNGKYVGVYCDDAATAARYRSLGVSYLAVNVDAGMLLSAARSIATELKA